MQLLTVPEAARLLRLSEITIRRYIASGKLTAVRVGRNVRIEQRDLERLASSTAAHQEQKPGYGQGKALTPESPFWQLVGIMKDGPPDLASNHDAYLADAYSSRPD